MSESLIPFLLSDIAADPKAPSLCRACNKEERAGAVPFEPAAYVARVGSCLTAQRQPQSGLVTFTAVLTRATANPASLLKYGHSFKNTNHNRYNVPQSLHLLSELFRLRFAYKIPAVAWVFQAVLGISSSSPWLASTFAEQREQRRREPAASSFAARLPNTSALCPPQQPA